jgi:hypothetical protein
MLEKAGNLISRVHRIGIMAEYFFTGVSAGINVVVVGLFTFTILRQYVNKRRLPQLYWGIGLCMALVATIAYIAMATSTPTSVDGIFYFRLYYLLGAALTPIWLGLGSLALVTPKKVAQTGFLLLCAVSLFTTVAIAQADIDLGALANVVGTAGAGVLQEGSGFWLPTIIVLNSLGVVLIVGVALYSGWQLVRRRSSLAGLPTGSLLLANLLILTGALIDAAAGTLARLAGLASGFWLVMAIGWSVFFWGVLLTTRRKRSPFPHAQAPEPVRAQADLAVSADQDVSRM